MIKFYIRIRIFSNTVSRLFPYIIILRSFSQFSSLNSILKTLMETNQFNFFCEEPVSCIRCEDIFEVHEDYQPFLKHLLDAHKFVISSPEEIADFREYVIYWKKLASSNLDDYCIIYITNTEDEAKEKSEHYYLLCDKLPEDKKIREILKKEKLNFLIHCKEEECQDKNFSRHCIYCPSIIGGGVANSFHHLTFEHGFSLGNPDNIVFGTKLLDIMEDMLKRLKCLHCEKTFRNYPGIPWEEVKHSIFTEKDVLLSSETELKEEEDIYDDEQLWTDWREETGDVACVCLFCPFASQNVDFILKHHMEKCHSFRFCDLTKDFNFYSKVKLINYIRTQVKNWFCIGCETQFTSSDDFSDHLCSCSISKLPSPHLWDNPIYMFPVLENDGLLIHLDDNAIDDEDTSSIASSVHEEIVLPEEAVALPSILNDWRLREELSDVENCSENVFFKCFFCSFRSSNSLGKSQCLNHMKSMHNFSYNDVFRFKSENFVIRAINYIRYM
ncbi:Zinc finger protein, partial [Armadillidium vulgare]